MRKVTTDESLLSAPLNAVMPRSSRVQALFWRPQYVSNDAILWHIPFLFWVLELSRPRQYVEIGVGEGVAYMAACQCLHRVQPDARCDAVGTWTAAGDVIDAPDRLVARNRDLYGHFSRIITDGIGQSDRYFAVATIDFLLIDLVATASAGLAGAVVVDAIQEKWLGKLSSESVILIHGTGRADADVAAFIDGMSARMPTIQLPGGEGMTVLLYGENVIEQLGDLVSLTDNHPEHQARTAFIEMFTRLGAANYYEMSSQSQEERASSVDRHLDDLKKEYEALSQQLRDSRAQYEGRHRQIANLQAKSFDLQIAEEMRRVEADRLKYRLKKVREEAVRFETQLDQAATLAREMQDNYDKAKSDFAELKAVAIRRKDQIERLSEELAALRTERDALEAHRKAEEAKSREAQQSHQVSHSKLMELEKLLSERGQQIAHLKQDLSQLGVERDELLKRQRSDAQIVQELEAAREADRSELSGLKALSDGLAADIERMLQEAKALHAERDDLLKRQRADAQIVQELEAAREADRSELSGLKALSDGRAADIERMLQEVKALHAERDELLKRQRSDAQIVQELEAAREADRSELIDLKAALDEHRADVVRLTEESDMLRADRNAGEKAYAHLEGAHQSTMSIVSQLKTLIRTHEGELVRLSAELAEAQQACVILSTQREDEKQAYRLTLEERQASFLAASAQYEHTVRGFEVELAKHQKENASLEAELAKAVKDLEDQGLAARAEFALQLRGTKILLDDLVHSENLRLSLKTEFGELKNQLVAAQHMGAEVQAYQRKIAELDEAIAERDAREAEAGETWARHFEGTKLLLHAMEQSENVIQALSMELRFAQDQLVVAQEYRTEIVGQRLTEAGADRRELEVPETAVTQASNARDMMVASIQAELAFEVQKTAALQEALMQFDSIAQALNAEIDYFQQQFADHATGTHASSDQDGDWSPRPSKLTLWSVALAPAAS